MKAYFLYRLNKEVSNPNQEPHRHVEYGILKRSWNNSVSHNIVSLDVGEAAGWCSGFVLVPKAIWKARLYIDLVRFS